MHTSFVNRRFREEPHTSHHKAHSGAATKGPEPKIPPNSMLRVLGAPLGLVPALGDHGGPQGAVGRTAPTQPRSPPPPPHGRHLPAHRPAPPPSPSFEPIRMFGERSATPPPLAIGLQLLCPALPRGARLEPISAGTCDTASPSWPIEKAEGSDWRRSGRDVTGRKGAQPARAVPLP